MTSIKTTLERLAERMQSDPKFVMEAAAVFYWRMIYGDWEKHEAAS